MSVQGFEAPSMFSLSVHGIDVDIIFGTKQNLETFCMVFGQALLLHDLASYGIDFSFDGGWDTHVKRVISNGRKK